MFNYEINRRIQQGCLSHDKTISEVVICEEYVNTFGSIADGYDRILKERPHLQTHTNLLSSEIIGEVANNFTFSVESVQVLVTIFDSRGNVIETKHGFPQDSYLKPGQISGFSVYLGNSLSPSANYVLTSIFKKSNLEKPVVLKLNVTSTSLNPVRIMGTVTNLGNKSTENVEASGIFYDGNHTVIDVATGSANNRTTLMPGENASFILPYTNWENWDKIKSYTLSVQSPDYFMAPITKVNTK